MEMHQNNPSRAEYKRVIFEGRNILKHNFKILSKNIDFTNEINWHTNFSDKSWPKQPYEEFRANNYDFNSKRYIGDIKLPWELNKHLHLQDLAKAYLISKDEKYAQEFIFEIEDWIKENPYRIGVNWIEGLIASHRAISWLITLSGFQKSPSVSKDFLDTICQSLKEHAEFIEDTYEFSDKASNHLLGELCTQIMLSNYFGSSLEADQRLKDALRNLEIELSKQVYDDGVGYEESVSYQRVILEFLYPVVILAKREKIKISKNIWKITEKMTEFMMHMTQPNGYLQSISDADGARVFILGNDINDFRPHLSLASWLFDRGDFKYVGDGHTDEIGWFLSKREFEEYKKIKSFKPKKTSIAFREGGYWISRTDWSKNASWLFFDCGFIGNGKWPKNLLIGTHGHSDTLNFGLNIAGVPFITDLGSYSYTTEQDFHDYFRSAKGHNTPMVDNQDQNIVANYPWSLFQYAIGENQEWFFSSEYDYLSGEHPGYLRLEKPVQVRREILFFKKSKRIIVKDSLIGPGRHWLEENFHFYPGVKFEISKDGILAKFHDQSLKILPLFSWKAEIVEGKKYPVEGWYAPNYGLKLTAPVLKFNKLVDSNEPLYFVFDFSRNELEKKELINYFEEISQKVRKPRKLELSKISIELGENYFSIISRKFLSRFKLLKKLFDILSQYYDSYRKLKWMYIKSLTLEPSEIITNSLTTLFIGYLIKRKNNVKIIYTPQGEQCNFITRRIVKKYLKNPN